MAYFRASLGGSGIDYAAGQGLDITNDIISLQTASSSQQGGAVIDGTSVALNSYNQIKALLDQTITLSDDSSTVSVGSTDIITATTDGGGILSVQSSNSNIATAVISNGEITITGVNTGNCMVTVTASATSDYGVCSTNIDVNIYPPIYGAEWDGSSSPVWTRTDAAAGFTDPNPYYAEMTDIPSSPFDNISPWKDIRIVEDSSAGTLVEIPKFYYKWTKSGNSMKLQLSTYQHSGFLISPAHADRGDGVGIRDYIYIGRYLCTYFSEYKSLKGYNPVLTTRSTARTKIHSVGSDIWQWDYATYWTLCMLYLVEFANWNSQAVIGYGGSSASISSFMKVGYTDSMPYHTGTVQANRTTYGGTQYRYVEGLWDNSRGTYVDGITSNSSNKIYCFKNPSQFSDSYSDTGATYVGDCVAGSGSSSLYGEITSYNISSVSGFKYVLLPASVITNDNFDTYICDAFGYQQDKTFIVGDIQSMSPTLSSGLFHLRSRSDSSSEFCRSMVLPPSRLSPPS